MASTPAPSKDEDEIPPPQRPPSPPPHTTFAARGIHPPTFSAFKPRDYKFTSPNSMSHVAWNCDGKKLAAVGIDRGTRVWSSPEKSMEPRSATTFSGGHSDEVDYVSWNPTHPDLFCTSSQRDRRIVFWDARQSRFIQQIHLKVSPVQTSYSPDGRTMFYITAPSPPNRSTMYFLECGKEGENPKEQWNQVTRDVNYEASNAIFNHTGTGLVTTYTGNFAVHIVNYPSLTRIESFACHVGGGITVALDPRGKYLATGGSDSIVNLIDTSDWVCTRTISICEHSINAISFSYDGEYLAIASAGNYIDICATETGIPLHRVPALAPAPTVAWHPSKYVVAYCGQTRLREGGPPPVAVVSMFGLLE